MQPSITRPCRAIEGDFITRWWRDILARVEAPPLFTCDKLAAQRWGPALDDPTSRIIVADC